MRRAFRWMWHTSWMRIPLIVLGIASICGAIWFGFWFTGVPRLQSRWLRGGLIGAILGVILLIWLIRVTLRRRAARRLEADLVETTVGDSDVLAERMRAALDKLKRSGSRSALYDLPWYMIIGPPGAGKTTALKNAGIEFPDKEGESVEGFGGTRNCDWWFAEDAVLLDTAGRYTTQDSDAAADSASWTDFLDLLKRNRPKQPINGVILAYSVEDMITGTPEMLEYHAEIVRKRLAELTDRFKITLPVYVLFTKADKIAGFREYFQAFGQQRRKAVWGATFQTKDRKAQTWKEVPAEFDALVTRLSDEVMDRMNEEPDSVGRISIFGLPGQMMLMRDQVADFLRRIFSESKHRGNAILRGFYFTSGTQEGNPIDQVLGAMSEGSDAAAYSPAFMSGKGKSFFLHDLLTKVIFEERDWVGYDPRAVRLAMVLRGTALTLVALATFGSMGLFGYGFWKNATLLQTSDQEQDLYAASARAVLSEVLIDDPDLSPVVPRLNELRDLTAGYGSAAEPPWYERAGLSRWGEVESGARTAYSHGLERLMRPRLMLHLENELPALIARNDISGGEIAEIYRTLKVYLLLGGAVNPVDIDETDDSAVLSYFEGVWTEQFSGAANAALRDELSSHLAAMLELDELGTELFAMVNTSQAVVAEQTLVEDARDAIVNLPIAEQAYAAIQDRAQTMQPVPDFNLERQVGGRVADVFQSKSGRPLGELGVPGLYTFEGYWGFFREEVAGAAERQQEDRWVLGDSAERVDFESQLGTLDDDLHILYEDDFVAAWNTLFDDLELAPMAADAPAFQTLNYASSPSDSPLLNLVRQVEEETRLTRLYDEIAGLGENDMVALAASGAGGGGLGASLGNEALRRFVARGGIVRQIMVEHATSLAGSTALGDGGGSGGGGALRDDIDRQRVERIERHFSDWFRLLGDETGGPRPIDGVLNTMRELLENRRLAARSLNPTDDQYLQDLLSTLTLGNPAFPDPFAGLVTEIETEFRAVAENESMVQLNAALNDLVTSFCRTNVEDQYPFAQSNRQISPAIFGQFFGPSGRVSQFYLEHLRQHVREEGGRLVPNPSSPLAGRLNEGSLRQLERALAIQLAFFATGTSQPQVTYSATLRNATEGIEYVELTINGSSARLIPGGASQPLSWPGAADVTIGAYPAPSGAAPGGSYRSGPWGIIDFLQRGGGASGGNQFEGSYSLPGGRRVTIQLTFDSGNIPFLMSELETFSCPISMD